MRQLLTTVTGILIAVLLPGLGYSQKLAGSGSDPKLTPGGGSAQSGGMGSLYSPNLYDGTVSVSIPIYDYSAEGADYGISLGFNTRGIKLNDFASNVGLGWNLNAYGEIRRVLKDLPDELHTEVDPDVLYSDPNSWLGGDAQVIINPERTFKGKLAWYNETLQQATDTTVYRDGESDDFNVTVGNLSFTFNLGKDGFVFTRPERNVKVEMLINGVVVTAMPATPATFTNLEFRITDEQGNQYYFVGGEKQNFQVMDKFGYGYNIGVYDAYTRWVIKKVTLASGAEIKYTYIPTSVGVQALYKRFTLMSRTDPYVFPPPSSEDVKQQYGTEFNLQKIEYPNNVTATIVYDTENRKDYYGNAVKEIQVASGTNMLRYKMQYAYWQSRVNGQGQVTPDIEVPYTTTTGNHNTHRLKLKGIRISGTSGTPEEPYYTFDYHDLQFPKRYVCSEDFFGYFNGNSSISFGSSGTPNWEFPFPFHARHFNNSSGGMDKMPKVDSTKLGILTKIKNAFGGEVAFEFDGHQLSNVLNTTNTPGLPGVADRFFGADANDGLRIKSITETDKFHPGNYRKTTFEFQDGQRFLSGSYYHYPTKFYGPQKDVVAVIMEALPMSPHQLVNGSNHGYSSAGMEVRNESGHLLSRQEVTFTNFSDALTGNQPRYTLLGSSNHFFTYPYTDKQYIRDWEMGLPLKIKEYDQQGRVATETINEYSFTTDLTSSLGKIENQKKVSVLWESSPLNYGYYYVRDNYRPYRGKVQLMQATVRKYLSDVSYMTDIINYEYDNRNNLYRMIARNSRGEEIQTINYYNYDVNTPAGGGTFNPLQGLEKIVSTQRWKRISGNTGPLPEAGSLQDGFFNSYVAESTGAQHKKIWNKSLYTARVPNPPLTYSQYLGTGSYNTTALKSWGAFNSAELPGFIKVSEVQLFDTKGNPLETKMGEQGQYKSMLWDTINGQKIAEVINARYSDIAYTSFEHNEPGPGGSLSVTRGSISYETTQVTNSPPEPAVSGTYAFRLSSALGGQLIYGSQNLTQGRKYILSFWSFGAVQPQVTIGNNPPLTLPTAICSTRELEAVQGQLYANRDYR
jgi:hypothetical protein